MEAKTKHNKKNYRYRTALNIGYVVGWNTVLYLLHAALYIIIISNSDKEIGLFWFWLSFAVLSVLLWIATLKVPLFYEDYIEIFFPLRPFKRTICVEYENLGSITFHSPQRSGDFMRFYLKNGTPRFKKYIRRCCYAPVHSCLARKNTRMNYLYLCRFLKHKGVAVRLYNDAYDRLELAFGPGDRFIPRLSIEKRNDEGKLMSLLLIVVFVWFMLMIVLILSLAQ